MSKYWKLLVALLAVFSLVAAACGDDDDPSTDDDPADDAAGNDNAPAADDAHGAAAEDQAATEDKTPDPQGPATIPIKVVDLQTGTVSTAEVWAKLTATMMLAPRRAMLRKACSRWASVVGSNSM